MTFLVIANALASFIVFFHGKCFPLTRNYVLDMKLVKSHDKNLDFEVKKAKFKLE
jgi:hypothetical protein